MTYNIINPHGIQVCVSPLGVSLSYALDSNEMIELYYKSIQSALAFFQVNNINDISSAGLLSKYYQTNNGQIIS
jgi:hypothetical protein